MNILNHLIKELEATLTEFDIYENIELRISNVLKFDLQINNLVKYQKAEKINELVNKFKKILDENKRIKNYEITEKFFINIDLNIELFLDEFENISEIIKSDKKEKIILDYGGPNIGKPLHVGHLRSLNIGRSLYRINKAAGNEVVSDIHLGDWGMPIAQILTYCKKNGIDTEKLTIDKLVDVYPKASSLYENDKAFQEKAREINLSLNNGDKNILKKWKNIKTLSLNSIKDTLKKLDHNFDLWLGESDVNSIIPKMLNDLKKNKKISDDDGALVSNLESDPKILITKSDGSYLYLTTDLATVLYRLKYHNFDKTLYIVDNRQAFHFKQLFDSINFFGFDEKNFEHVSFGTVNDTSGNPLKTRAGGTKALNELFEDTCKYINKINKELSDKNLEILANTVLTYSDLISNRKTDYKFDLEKFTNINGKTGIYVQYAQVRANKIFADSGLQKKDLELDPSCLDVEDIELLKCLILFELYFNQSLINNEPHHIADYLFQISSLFNKMYQSENILNNENKNKKLNKLLISNYFIKYSNMTMDLLGIQPVQKM